MKRSYLIILKTAVWVACLWPMALLVRGALTPHGLGADPTAHIALTTGYTTLMLLTITLGITPVRRLSPRLGWMIRFRRLLGLFAFFYATVHMLTYVALYSNFSVQAMMDDIAKRRFITMGVAAYLLLIPLAITSTNWSIRKLGGKRWSRLHKLVYVAAICGAIHYWWQVKTGVLLPLPFTVAIALLLLARPVLAWKQRRKMRAAETV
ncbi:MAG TPA: protein-methionine-sulfoxide reductase heme-binding subunit MsrQ [Terracidiphilus sp.]|jgi:sulfoxide reductase heme-binding subunit YedZ|nr:protein-methionine-sulfoxide reductase heme-binding subunit MsrQ [Terracidiphilus sp.]